jgi:hypothetical protein
MELKKYLQEMQLEKVLIHPKNNSRSVFYAIFLALQIDSKFPNIQIDFIFPKEFTFLRNLLSFKIGKFKSNNDYDIYISYLDDYKEVWKYRIIKSRAKIGLSKLLYNKVFDFLVPVNDNYSILTKSFLDLLKIRITKMPEFIQNPFIPIISNNKQLLISPYKERYIKKLVEQLKGDFDILYIKKESLEYIFTRAIFPYKKVIAINSRMDHFLSFLRKDIEIIFAAVDYRTHLYSNNTVKRVIDYPCAPCNIDSVDCPFKHEDKKYKCLRSKKNTTIQ